MEKIYEGSAVVVTAAMAPDQAKQLKSLTFKFLADGEPAKADDLSKGDEFEKEYKTAGADGSIEHRVHAPKVPGDKDTYVLTYHIFYEVESKGGKTVKNQELSVKQFQVFPRTAKLKAVWDKGDNAGKPFTDFRFKVMQGGAQVGEARHTLANDTKDVNGETIPAGSAVFNLEMIPGYGIVQESPWEIISGEADAKDKRSYSVKGDLKFRAAFLNPPAGRVRQFVNYDAEDRGQQGIGDEVIVEVGVAGDAPAGGKQEIHFRATFGPEAGGPIAKSKRKDSEHPTKIDKADKADKATIEEKKAGEKYEGKFELENGRGRIKVCLGRAGGDTCKLEIAGSDKFLKDKSVQADQALEFENWRKVHYELMVPDSLYEQALDPETLEFRSDARQRLETLGRQVFVEFEHDDTRVFDTLGQADHGSLGPKRFFGLPGDPDKPAYILSGRNWRETPRGQAWAADNPSKTLYISLCDLLLKWKKDTSDPGAGPKDFSGTLTEATGEVDVEQRFQGLFMPFSGYDGGDGVTQVTWRADISKDDPVCSVKPQLTVEEVRYDFVESDEINVEINCGPAFGLPLELGFHADDKGKFASALDEGQAARIQAYAQRVLKNLPGLAATGGKVKAEIVCPKAGNKGEDGCLGSVKAKFQGAFDKAKKDVAYHPGLTPEGEPRAGACRLADITDMRGSTSKLWRFYLPVGMPDGSIGPGAFVGKKSKDKCPVKLEFSFQPHEASPGEAEGKLLAWACAAAGANGQLLRLVLRSFRAESDKAALPHGHGDEGKAGDCLEKADALCEKCLDYGRAASLATI